MAKVPYAWIFFLLFILIATFIVVNLFIAVIVDSLNNVDNESASADSELSLRSEVNALRAQIEAQHQDLRELKALLQAQASRKPLG
jgi:voltage-gated sodium channel